MCTCALVTTISDWSRCRTCIVWLRRLAHTSPGHVVHRYDEDPDWNCKCSSRTSAQCTSNGHTAPWCYVDSVDSCSDAQNTTKPWSEAACMTPDISCPCSPRSTEGMHTGAMHVGVFDKFVGFEPAHSNEDSCSCTTRFLEAGPDIHSTREMFSGAASFNQNVAPWKTKGVADMHGMFAKTRVFNQNIGGWALTAATNVSSMFANAKGFNQNVGHWRVGTVVDMKNMFAGAAKFGADISKWQTTSVADISGMLQNTKAFDHDLTSWANCAGATDFSGFSTGSGLRKEHTPQFGAKSFRFRSSAELKGGYTGLG